MSIRFQGGSSGVSNPEVHMDSRTLISCHLQMIALQCCTCASHCLSWATVLHSELVVFECIEHVSLSRLPLQAIARKLVELRIVLPSCDLSKLVARFPPLLLELEASAVAAQVSSIR